MTCLPCTTEACQAFWMQNRDLPIVVPARMTAISPGPTPPSMKASSGGMPNSTPGASPRIRRSLAAA